MFNYIRVFFRQSNVLRKFIGVHLAPSGMFDWYFRRYRLPTIWQTRLNNILRCPDYNLIPKHANAGVIRSGKQFMHNGLCINVGSYYGPEFAAVFQKTKGVHEPQEEYIFGLVLKKLKMQSVMLELGSFWSFYSMWFNKEISQAKNYLVEPSSFNLELGKSNFRLNKMDGSFFNYFIGSSSKLCNKGTSTICVDDFCTSNHIEELSILHADIDGFEVEMLMGAQRMLRERRIEYIFISSHSNELHNKCIDILQSHSYHILCEADLNRTFSEDGLIVGCRNNQNKDEFKISYNY